MKVPGNRLLFLICTSFVTSVVLIFLQSLLMAHALHRISYCTCVPEERMFCFLSREPKGPVNIQLCHTFITAKSSQVSQEAIVIKSRQLPLGWGNVL